MASLNPLPGTLSRTQAAHLLRRVTFGPTKLLLDSFQGLTVDQAVDQMFVPAGSDPDLPLDPATGLSFVHREELDGGTLPDILRAYTRSWWINLMINGGNSALEKVVFFLHSHFTTSADKVAYAFPLYHQNTLFRKFAFGNFRDLAEKVCRDYAMSVFLDGWTNRVGSPNENFAREFLELYTIGKGEQIGPGNYTTYTEDDVREAARVLTGYIPSGYFQDEDIPPQIPIQIDPDTGLYMSSIFTLIHDSFPKVFSPAFQSTVITSGSNSIQDIESELSDFIAMIFNQQATAEHICRKIYRFFVYYEIDTEIETDIIQQLAMTMIANNYELIPVFKQLFKSEHFFDVDDVNSQNDRLGAIIKSPIEFVLGTSRWFNIPIPGVGDLVNHLGSLLVYDAFGQYMDMELFETPEVAGWPAYHQAPFYNRNWLNASTLVNRYAVMEALVRGFPVNDGAFILRLNILDFVANHITTPADPNVVVEELSVDLFPLGISDVKKAILKNLLLDGDIDSYWTQTWADYLQGGNEATARFRLESLIDAILQSPEYQLQ